MKRGCKTGLWMVGKQQAKQQELVLDVCIQVLVHVVAQLHLLAVPSLMPAHVLVLSGGSKEMIQC